MTAALAPVRINEVLRVARARNASDVHLCASVPPVLRVDGNLDAQSSAPATDAELDALACALLDAEAARRLAESGDVTVSCRLHEMGDVRVHVYRTSQGLNFAIRLLAANVPSLESLHLPHAVRLLADRRSGLVIFAGPTGSGKSTSMAALIDLINRTHSRHIMTVEDPIEYLHAPKRSIVNQRELGRDVPSYADALRGALRSDPDVILIGEARDVETMHAALTAAETGHLVLTTLHTGDAAQTVERVIGMFEGDTQGQIRTRLAQTLAAIVCTRLIPRSDARGRLSAVEILLANDAVRNLIRDGKTHQIRNVIATSRQTGMQTLEAHLSELVAYREVSLESARTATERPEDVRADQRPAP